MVERVFPIQDCRKFSTNSSVRDSRRCVPAFVWVRDTNPKNLCHQGIYQANHGTSEYATLRVHLKDVVDHKTLHELLLNETQKAVVSPWPSEKYELHLEQEDALGHLQEDFDPELRACIKEFPNLKKIKYVTDLRLGY